MSDDRIYDMVSLYPDMGGKLREKVIHQIDPHAVPSFRDGYFVEVAALHGTRDIPIYLERSIIRSGVRRFAPSSSKPCRCLFGCSVHLQMNPRQPQLTGV